MSSLAPIAPDVQVEAVLRGVEVVVHLSVDRGEISRRVAAGVAGRRLAGMRALGALLELPEGVLVDVATLAPVQRAVMDRLVGAVDYSVPGFVRRVARPAVWARLVSIQTSRWRDGLRLAGRFAPYSARRLVLDCVPFDVQVLCLEASYWGVGVSVKAEGVDRELVPPALFLPTRYTAAAWSFDEELYAQL